MSENPYAPPRTFAERSARPTSVTYAVGLLWLSIAISVLAALRNFRVSLLMMQAGASSAGRPEWVADISALLAAAPGGLWIGLQAWVISRVAAGRSWARWLFLALLAIEAPAMWPMIIGHTTVLALDEGAAFFKMTSAVIWLLRLVLCGLLFTPHPAAWFKTPRPT